MREAALLRLKGLMDEPVIELSFDSSYKGGYRCSAKVMECEESAFKPRCKSLEAAKIPCNGL